MTLRSLGNVDVNSIVPQGLQGAYRRGNASNQLVPTASQHPASCMHETTGWCTKETTVVGIQEHTATRTEGRSGQRLRARCFQPSRGFQGGARCTSAIRIIPFVSQSKDGFAGQVPETANSSSDQPQLPVARRCSPQEAPTPISHSMLVYRSSIQLIPSARKAWARPGQATVPTRCNAPEDGCHDNILTYSKRLQSMHA